MDCTICETLLTLRIIQTRSQTSIILDSRRPAHLLAVFISKLKSPNQRNSDFSLSNRIAQHEAPDISANRHPGLLGNGLSHVPPLLQFRRQLLAGHRRKSLTPRRTCVHDNAHSHTARCSTSAATTSARTTAATRPTRSASRPSSPTATRSRTPPTSPTGAAARCGRT